MVFQDPRAEFFTRDATSELAFPCENFVIEPGEIRARIGRVARSLTIEHLLGRQLTELSSGEKQKIAIGAALMLQPPVLLYHRRAARPSRRVAVVFVGGMVMGMLPVIMIIMPLFMGLFGGLIFTAMLGKVQRPGASLISSCMLCFAIGLYMPFVWMKDAYLARYAGNDALAVSETMGRVRARAWVVGAAIAATVIGAALFRPVRFPRPGGRFSVGTTTRQWRDHTRPEILSRDPDDTRELSVQVWYPTTANRGTRSIYLADAPVVFASFLQALREVTAGRTSPPAFLFRKLARSRTNAFIDAPAMPGTRFPVIVALSGFGGFRTANTILIEALASRGYVVVGVDQPYVSARARLADGRVVKMKQRGHLYDQHTEDEAVGHLAADVSFVLDKIATDPMLARTSTTLRAGVMGVSLGGTVAAAAARADPRIAACLMMDAAMPADAVAHGIPCDALWLTRPAEDMRRERRQAGGWPEDAIENTLGSMKATLGHQTQETGRLISIPGTFHVDFTDAPHWFPWARWLGLSGRIGARRAHQIIIRSAADFFHHALISNSSAHS